MPESEVLSHDSLRGPAALKRALRSAPARAVVDSDRLCLAYAEDVCVHFVFGEVAHGRDRAAGFAHDRVLVVALGEESLRKLRREVLEKTNSV